MCVHLFVCNSTFSKDLLFVLHSQISSYPAEVFHRGTCRIPFIFYEVNDYKEVYPILSLPSIPLPPPTPPLDVPLPSPLQISCPSLLNSCLPYSFLAFSLPFKTFTFLSFYLHLFLTSVFYIQGGEQRLIFTPPTVRNQQTQIRKIFKSSYYDCPCLDPQGQSKSTSFVCPINLESKPVQNLKNLCHFAS